MMFGGGGSKENSEEEEHADASKFWSDDMNKMQLGTKMVFVNDFAGAESVFRNGMMNEREIVGNGIRDLRGAFALNYALVSVIKGVASLANDQLDDCLKRLWFAEELASKEKEWLGKTVVRGICTLMGGVIQCLQHSFVKGVYNVLKSWLWIKVLKTEAINYQGKEREVVRSCALFTLGIFNILLSLLPTSMLRAATFLSGFSGDRDAGLGLLMECWKENGMFTPWAALVWVAYNVDTKAFLDESLTEDDLEKCGEIFSWAQKEYPNSVFFSGIEADFEACRKNINTAIQIIDRAAPYTHELKALEWALNYKKGIYELTGMHFAKAAVMFENSLEVYVRVGRRSMVPFMAMYSALCYHVVADQLDRKEREKEELEGEEQIQDCSNSSTQEKEEGETGESEAEEMDACDARAHAEEMLCLVAKYKAMNKDNWGRQDRWAFKVYREYDTLQSADVGSVKEGDSVSEVDAIIAKRDPWPLLDLIECMIWRMRCTRWMDDGQVARMLALLQADQSNRGINPDDEIRVCASFSQVLLERGQSEPALEWCEKGLAVRSELSAFGKETGFDGMLLYLKGVNMYQRGQMLSAKHCVQLLDTLENKKSWIYNYVLFKSNLLKKQLGDTSEEDMYEKVDVPAGDSHQYILPIDDPERPVTWDWAVVKHDIQFTVIFRPTPSDASSESGGDDSEIIMIESIERHDEKEGPCIGQFQPSTTGDIIFEWDNRYSFLRSKQVLFRVCQLEFDEM